jgi:hypothetical protein
MLDETGRDHHGAVRRRTMRRMRLIQAAARMPVMAVAHHASLGTGVGCGPKRSRAASNATSARRRMRTWRRVMRTVIGGQECPPYRRFLRLKKRMGRMAERTMMNMMSAKDHGLSCVGRPTFMP